MLDDGMSVGIDEGKAEVVGKSETDGPKDGSSCCVGKKVGWVLVVGPELGATEGYIDWDGANVGS